LIKSDVTSKFCFKASLRQAGFFWVLWNLFLKIQIPFINV